MTARRYRKISDVLAEQATEPGRLTTPEGVMSFNAGDYLVSDRPPTRMWPVKREVFERTYRLVEDERKALRRELAEFADVIDRMNRKPLLDPEMRVMIEEMENR